MSNVISRREALRQLGLSAAGIALTLSARTSRAERRPNFVFILTDDQRWDAMSNMPNAFSFLHTPNIDRLASEGARFENSFVTISLCSPSRSCFLTGRYAHSHGVRTNERNDPYPGVAIYPALLQQAGYRTAYVGKWHMKPDASPRPGFDYWLSFVGQGRYENPPMNENGHDFEAQGYMTDLLTDYATRWLSQQDSPFCLLLAHKAMHDPFIPAPRHAAAFPDAEIPEPVSFQDNLRGKPAWMRRSAVYGARAEQWAKSEGKSIPDELSPVRWNPRAKDRLDYLRTLLAVDDSVGRVLETLEQMDQLDDTVIIFASDNGFFLGEHRRGDKRLAYDEALRIPFLMRYPRLVRPGSRPMAMVLNIDVAPTILDLAGLEPPKEMQGRSFRPVLEGRTKGWRNAWLYEYFREGWLPGVPTILGVRTERWKYVTYPDIQDLDELYDLQSDPHEMTNLAQDADHHDQLEEMKRELERLKRETGYSREPELKLPAVSATPEALLVFTFNEDKGDRATDDSGRGNHGRAQGAPLVDGRAGGKAREFDGKSYVAVGKAPSLDVSMRPLTVAAVVKTQQPNGVILARGGQTQGFALYLDEGKPVFAVRSGGSLNLAAGQRSVLGDWVELTAILAHDLKMTLYVNGEKVAENKADWFIGTDPNEGLEVGQDRGTKVGAYDSDNGFTGLIDEVQVYSGEKPPQPK